MLAPTDRARRLAKQFRHTERVDLGTVLVKWHSDAAHLTVNNQHCLNAEDNRLVADMETAVDLVALHERARGGVLRGGVMTHPKYVGKRVFSAGINLRELHAGRISFVDFLLGREMGYARKFLHGVLTDPDRAARSSLVISSAPRLGCWAMIVWSSRWTPISSGESSSASNAAWAGGLSGIPVIVDSLNLSAGPAVTGRHVPVLANNTQVIIDGYGAIGASWPRWTPPPP
jgi:hypothetical protein